MDNYFEKITQEELLEKAKESDDKNFYKGSKDQDANPTEVPDPQTGELVPYEEPIYSEKEQEAVKIQFRDWDDCVNKTYYVLKDEFENTVGQSVGIQFREYGMNTLQEAMASLYTFNDTTFAVKFKDLSKLEFYCFRCCCEAESRRCGRQRCCQDRYR